MKIPFPFDPFNKIIGDRQRCSSDHPDVSEFTVHAQDGIRIEGWNLQRPDSKGTIFILHGFCRHSGDAIEQGLSLSQQFKVNIVAHDSRHHGRSADAFPTFGTAEMWDLQAVLSHAESIGLCKPFILIGDSLGAMAAQRVAISDGRIRGALCLNPPGWPADALGVTLGAGSIWAVKAGIWLIKNHYGWDVVTDGDIRGQNPFPEHQPYMLYMVEKMTIMVGRK
jgi:pimeloyl-ACP methyl ester carboxylesterase